MSKSPRGSTTQSDAGSTTATHAATTTFRPFNRVPPELLSHILTLSWGSYRGDDSLDRFRFPTIPCEVDRYFNRIAISTPLLWSYLRVSSMTELAHIEERIHRRSGALPLDLYLIFKDVTYEEARILMEKIILQSSSHFQTITLSYSRSSILQIPHRGGFWDHLGLFDECPLHAGRFCIESYHAPPIDFLPPFTSSIRRLELFCRHFNWSHIPLLDSLEVLSIKEVVTIPKVRTTAEIVQFFSGSLSYSLTSLTRTGILIDCTDGALSRSCTLGSLNYLKLDEFFVSEAAMLCTSILAPNLRHLSFSTIYEDALPEKFYASWKALRFSNLRIITLQDIRDPRLVEVIPNFFSSMRCLEVIGDTIKTVLRSTPTTFWDQLNCVITHGVALDALVPLVEGRCTALQELEVRYKDAFQVNKHLVRDELVRCFDILNGSVAKLRILEDGGSPEADEPASLMLERLFTCCNNERYPDLPWEWHICMKRRRDDN